MVRITLTDDELREMMLRVLDFYCNRTLYINQSFVQHFRLYELTDAVSTFLIEYFRE